jgi:hypothetical protein
MPAMPAALRRLLAREPGPPGCGAARAVHDGPAEAHKVANLVDGAITGDAHLERRRATAADGVVRLRRIPQEPTRVDLVVANEAHVAVGQREGRHAVEGAGRRSPVAHPLAAHAEADDVEVGRKGQLGAVAARYQLAVTAFPGPGSLNVTADGAAGETEQGRRNHTHGGETGGAPEEAAAIEAHRSRRALTRRHLMTASLRLALMHQVDLVLPGWPLQQTGVVQHVVDRGADGASYLSVRRWRPGRAPGRILTRTGPRSRWTGWTV